MNNIFSFRLPARPGLSHDSIAKVIEEWVNSSRFYSFDPLRLLDIEGYMDFACSEACLEYIKTMDEAGYGHIGARLSKSDESNVTWVADFIYECSAGGSFFYVQLSRSVADTEGRANMKILPQMPDVVKQVMRQDMLLDDGGFPITDGSLALSTSVLQKCKVAFDQKMSPILPIIFANCTGNPEMKRRIDAVAKDFSGMAHVIAAQSEDEVLQWWEIDNWDLWLQGFEGAAIYFPRISIVKRISFQDEFEDILICMTAYISQQNLPASTMTWEKLKSLLKKDSDPARFLPDAPSGEYCFMNRQMAEFIKTVRKRVGLSQAELAAKADTTGLIISRLETLRITRVKRGLLQKIEEAFNLRTGTISLIENTNPGVAAAEEGSKTAEGKSSGAQTGCVQNLFCRRCGAKLFRDSIFCHQCGTKLPE